MKLICWLIEHKLIRVSSSPNGDLERLHCTRCKRFYALFHPSKWFWEWDHEDELTMRQLKRSRPLGS